ncbi:transcriptional regulator [Citrobacter amalonaticus]|uniref:PapB/FocB family fimbrial expression transcriptional regulator n=1 Tax=Citrobacter amalonaticus TaxID=35703 RepID=UPI0019042F06|nr:PapB/FocB family fimbrial expression transcriptional regulator [Citrobacter amalonaticus]MBJ9260672.1 transcriptional regulator [Citrobacter amalonaticus]
MRKNIAIYLNEKDALVPGDVSENQFWLLIEISSIHSVKVIKALKEHLVSGLSKRDICERHCMNAGYLSTSLNRLYYINERVQQLVPYYSRHSVGGRGGITQ